MVRAGDVDYPTSDLVGAAAGLLLAGTTIIATKAAKQALFQATSAAAIDLESGAVAQVAQRYNLPFAVLRAICDPAERDLPPAALSALNHNGAIGLWRVVASIAANPGQIPNLIALAQDAAHARRALLNAAQRMNWRNAVPVP
jgi:adenosylhomocysteine nucleosidase